MTEFFEKYKSLGINKERSNIIKNDVKDWHQYFLKQAYAIAKKSHDAQTKHGIVLVKDKSIIVTGFNGFPSGSMDNIIPNIRPYKYNFINHAEESAIFQAAKRGVSVVGATAYITGMPCCHCARKLVSVGIFDWYIGHTKFIETEQESLLRDFWIDNFSVKIIKLS